MLLLFLLENKLIFPAPKYPSGDWNPNWLQYEDVDFKSVDGTALHGWFLDHPNPNAYLLYCHGNGEHVAYTASILDELRSTLDVAVFVFDYRGYGRSDGSPHEAGILADGEAADAVETFAAILEEDHMNAAAAGGLIRSYLAMDDAAQAEAVLNGVPAEISEASEIETARAAVELAKQAETLSPGIKIMFITGFAAVAMQDPHTADSATVLSKPVHLRQLVNEVDKLIAA
mgnify:CR=1 FL=1